MKKLVVVLCMACMASAALANIAMPAYFTDNMVLQQKSEVTFHGRSSVVGQEVTVKVSWNKTVFRAPVGSDGTWSVKVPTLGVGGPYAIRIADGDSEKVLSNVMVGEVWLCSGQSNMEMPVAGWGKVQNYEQEVAEANYPSVRLFKVKLATALSPATDFETRTGGWKECSPEVVPEFSSVGYFFARRMWQELRIPIGMIDCTWGGTPAESWTSFGALKQVREFKEEMECLQSLGFDPQKMQDRYNKEKITWISQLVTMDKGLSGNKASWAAMNLPEQDWKLMSLPRYLEHSDLGNFDGVVWFRRQVSVPDGWKGKPLTLSLAMIDDEDVVYCNGTEIGRGSGYNTPRKYTVPAGLTNTSELVITVRVSDFGGEGGIYGAAESMFLSGEGGTPVPLSGDWKYKVGISLADLPNAPMAPNGNTSYPTSLYNAMVNPLIQFPVKGILWYQGEHNTGYPDGYADLFQTLINDWRAKWNNPDMPFYYVQLANFMERKEVQPNSNWALIREAQSKAFHLANTGMVVNIDLGEMYDIHPKNKQDVAARLSLLALQHTYGKKVVSQAPAYSDYKIESDKVRVSFTNVGKGFRSGSELKGFVVAGVDHVFYPAVARMVGNEVIVSSPLVKNPIAVRYGWADNPECTLYGVTGLPVSPFRTDTW